MPCNARHNHLCLLRVPVKQCQHACTRPQETSLLLTAPRSPATTPHSTETLACVPSHFQAPSEYSLVDQTLRLHQHSTATKSPQARQQQLWPNDCHKCRYHGICACCTCCSSGATAVKTRYHTLSHNLAHLHPSIFFDKTRQPMLWLITQLTIQSSAPIECCAVLWCAVIPTPPVAVLSHSSLQQVAQCCGIAHAAPRHSVACYNTPTATTLPPAAV